jgi:hypothetical protein
MFRRCRVARLAGWILLVVVLASLAAGSSAAATVKGEIFLLQGENLRALPRQLPSSTVKATVGVLLKGPTATEKKSDVRSQIPAGTKVRGATVKSGVATIDLTRPFVEGTNRSSLVARLTQLVWTATGIKGVTGVRLWIDGKAAKSMGQGLSVDRTLTRTNVDPAQPALLPPTSVVPDKTGPSTEGGTSTKWIQQRLVDLGYLPSSAVTGHYGPWTTSAVLAFQGWEKLTPRDGIAGPATVARLKTAKRPAPGPDQGQHGRAGLCDPAGELRDLPQGAQGLVVSLLGLAAVRQLLQRRHRLPRVAGCTRLPGLARLRPRPPR